MRYAILGPVELWDDAGGSVLAGPREVALLAMLVTHAGKALTSDHLIEAVWGSMPPDGAMKRLQVAVARLRGKLDGGGATRESVLRTIPGGYVLSVTAGELDADVFQTLAEDGRRALHAGDAVRARELLREALGLWRGPALADVAYQDFAQPAIRRLAEQRLMALEASVDAELELGGHAGVIAELEALVAEHPDRERLAGLLMLALYRCGRQAEALGVYARTRGHLSGELGLEPGLALQQLQREILDHVPSLAAPGRGRAPGLGPAPRGLPRRLRPTARELPFTGRAEQLAALTSSWAEVGPEALRMVMVSGEAGIGKTRSAAELAAVVHDEGARVLYGTCAEGLPAPFQPFVEALRDLLGSLDPVELRGRLGGLAPELAILLPEVDFGARPAAADAESARLALFEAVAAVFEIATEQQRTLLVVDDVHWAAPATLLMLRHLIRSPRRLALLVVVTYRSTEVRPHQPLARLVAELQRDSSVRHVALAGLDDRSVQRLVNAAFEPSAHEPPPRFAARVHAETAGNPFFVSELVADVLEAGGTEAGPDAEPGDRLDVPDRLRGIITQRVARLTEPGQRLVAIASVAPGTNAVSLLQPLFAGEEDLVDALDEAIAEGLLVETAPGEFSFAHALVRHAVYDSLGMARRLHLHRRLGEALEARDDAMRHAEALAYHFAELASHGEAGKAIDYAIAAGRAAADRLAYEDAAAHFQRGLDIVARLDVDAVRHLELLLELGSTRWSTGDSDGARLVFEQASDLAYTHGDAVGAGRAALGFSGPLFFEVGAEMTRDSARMLRRALAMREGQDSALKTVLMGRLSAACAYAGEPRAENQALALRALRLARRGDDKQALADVLATTYWATRGPDNGDQHLEIALELVRLSEEIDDLRLLAFGRGWVVSHHLERGDVDAALRELAQVRDLAARRGDRLALWLAAAAGAVDAFIRGQLDESEALAFEAVGYWTDQPQLAPPTQVFGVQLIFVRREQGRLDELVMLVEAYAEQTPEVPSWRCMLGLIRAHLGEPELAARELEIAGDPDALPRDALWLLSVVFVATATSMLGDVAGCRRAYDVLLPYADTWLIALTVMCEGSVARPLGMLATILGRYDDAEAHFERALAMNAQIRATLWTAHTQVEYARMLRLRGRSGDGEHADLLLAEGLRTADELGLVAVRARAAGATRGA
jgi:DNA-binding SARP family transcriptional activator